ncbi:hypothetical protein NDU88_005520 [Pleurodeles waltl]|uniref:Uncharacterized protein n=1 Tax=Pleurodeles waltl TaxID=8319 RepID=A0AAV7WXW1_PLEWA|nr:hypothetical protein NDU88_005520 [Pleurodeles waltl]
MAWRPQARLREPRSGPAGWGQYATRSPVSAGGRFPPRARSGSRAGITPRRPQVLPSSGFLSSRSQGATKTPLGSRLGQSRIEYGSGFGRVTEGSGALLECDRHLDARGHAPRVAEFSVGIQNAPKDNLENSAIGITPK